MPAFRATRMKEKIVEVPKDEVPVALIDPQPVAPGIGLEKDPTVEEQSEKLGARKVILPAQLLDLSRHRQHGQSGSNLRIADLEQGASVRQFEHQLASAPPHVSQARENKTIRSADLRDTGPVTLDLRLDDDEVLAFPHAREVINQEAAFRQTPDEKRELLLNLSAAPRKRSERQTLAQLSRAFRGPSAEASHAHRIAIGIS